MSAVGAHKDWGQGGSDPTAISEAVGEANLGADPAPDAVQFTSLTPSGIEVLYQAAPKRLYRLRKHVTGGAAEWGTEWVEVPSVTTVIDVLGIPLGWWGMTVGVEGVLELFKRGVIHQAYNGYQIVDAADGELTAEDVVRFLTQNKLTVNHTLTKAGDRGTSVHQAFEDWAINGTVPHPEIYPEDEKPYVEGLRKFIRDIEGSVHPAHVHAEVTVGSIEHGYAGRYDLRIELSKPTVVVTKTYPKRANKVEEIPAGVYLLDLKTSKDVYKKHALQLAAYEGASVECGYEPTDYQAVVHVTKHGQYELVRTTATLDDFLSVRETYSVMQKKMTV